MPEPGPVMEMNQRRYDFWDWSERWWSTVGGPACTCGHERLGPVWHGYECPWAAWAWRRKAHELLEEHIARDRSQDA